MPFVSRSTRSLVPGWEENWAGKILLATLRSNRVSRARYLAHSARTQRREDFVGPEFGARSKRHTWPRLYSGKARRVFNTALQRRSTPLLLEVTGDSAGLYAIVVGRRANRMLFRARSPPYR